MPLPGSWSGRSFWKKCTAEAIKADRSLQSVLPGLVWDLSLAGTGSGSGLNSEIKCPKAIDEFRCQINGGF
jgi:hypothetical protein